MAWWNPFNKSTVEAKETVPLRTTASSNVKNPFEVMSASISNIVKDTEDMTSTIFNNTNELCVTLWFTVMILTNW